MPRRTLGRLQQSHYSPGHGEASLIHGILLGKLPAWDPVDWRLVTLLGVKLEVETVRAVSLPSDHLRVLDDGDAVVPPQE